MSEALQLIEHEKDKFIKVCSDPSIEFEREASFAMQILNGNDFLMQTAMRNKPSLQAAITNVAAIGISLNPASKLAYLVPRDGKVCLDISYMGMMHLAQQTGAILWGQAAIVKANDTFELNGIDNPPIHKFNPFAEDRGEIVGVYVVVKTGNNDYLTHAMPISKVNDIRDRSAAWKAWIAKKAKCPWVTDYEEMAKKTCVKQAAKYWPRRDRLDSAIHYMNVEGDEGLVIEKEVEEVKEGLPFKPGKGIAARDGYMESLDAETQAIIMDIAENAKALMGNPTEAKEFISDQLEATGLLERENIMEIRIALFDRFSSSERAALKKA